MKSAAAEAAGHGLRRPAVPDAGGAGVLSASRWRSTENRYLALGLLAGLYAVLGVGLLVAVRQALLYGPPPFSATLEELGRDAELLERVRDAQDEDPRRRGGLSHDQAFSSIDRAVRIELCARAPSSANPWPRASPAPPQAGAGLAHQEPAAGWRRAMRHAGPCRPSAWRAVIHWSARRCPPCSCGARFRLLKSRRARWWVGSCGKPGRKRAARPRTSAEFTSHPPSS